MGRLRHAVHLVGVVAPVALVTGATGFIGSHLVAQLKTNGWEVRALVRADASVSDAVAQHLSSTVVDGDNAALTEAVKNINPTAVFHLATHFTSAHQGDEVEALIAANVTLGTRLLEACTGLDVAFVNVGTIWQHYDARSYSPVSLYGATKQAFADIARYYVELNGIRMVTVELSDTYGAGDRRRKVIQLLMESAINNTPLLMSPGEQLMFLLHVDDVANALIAATELADSQGNTYSLPPGEPVSLKELAARVQNVIGLPVPVEFGAREYRPREMMHSWHVSPALPGWQPQVTLDEGLAQVWADLRADQTLK